MMARVKSFVPTSRSWSAVLRLLWLLSCMYDECTNRSGVRKPSSRVRVSAFWMASECSLKPRNRSIIREERSRAVGFALSVPTRSGAVPCTASKMLTCCPMFAEGQTPSPPMRPAQRSLTMSPIRFGATKTSNMCGCETNFMHRSSMMMSSHFRVG